MREGVVVERAIAASGVWGWLRLWRSTTNQLLSSFWTEMNLGPVGGAVGGWGGCSSQGIGLGLVMCKEAFGWGGDWWVGRARARFWGGGFLPVG